MKERFCSCASVPRGSAATHIGATCLQPLSTLGAIVTGWIFMWSSLNHKYMTWFGFLSRVANWVYIVRSQAQCLSKKKQHIQSHHSILKVQWKTRFFCCPLMCAGLSRRWASASYHTRQQKNTVFFTAAHQPYRSIRCNPLCSNPLYPLSKPLNH